ncbi:acetyltransferase [Mycolicibacterium sp. 050158]|uniref:acetyltransferase n=1 Tax=Mycolicibacterium sp. 050158 TaxID=3090602 RepID=UPI00299E87A6|nr:acetyltransferase [Mycolicibacterium sp. 050158]MDX1893176.1 acetyltransferase [Mycolicibacterium sp. 050158]
MSARITPLRLEAFEQLPKHARRCVFWEVDPSTLQGPDSRPDHLADPEFEKEAWLSMVMLEWGSCGQLAVSCEPEQADFAASTLSGDEPCLGFAFYAPPRAVPRAGLFPTGPVGADAVLLTTVGVESGSEGEDLTRALMAAVVGDLVRRGVRALEAFGRTAEALELTDPALVPPDLRPAVEALGDCSVEQCIIDADFLLDVGFQIVAPHRYFPRLRLELEQGLGWKADVEAALERLLVSARMQQPVMAGAAPCV